MEKKETLNVSKVITDQYEIIEKVGDGGMAEVYRARQKTLNREVALKLIIPTKSNIKAQKLLHRFLREAQMTVHLQHPNIVTVFDVSDDLNAPYIAMEYVDGATFSDLVHGGLSLDEALPLFVDVAEALAFAHDEKIIHRDLKPANILVSKAKQAKVADWGLAKPMEAVNDLTATGGRLGTPLYMAPEQVDGHNVSPKSDLYTLGIIMYRTALISGGLKRSKAMEFLARHQTKAVSPLSTYLPKISPRFDNLVAKLMEKNPRKRPQNAKAVAEELRLIIEGEEEEFLTEDTLFATEVEITPLSVQESQNRPKLLFGMATVLLTIILSCYAFSIFNRHKPKEPPLVLIRFSLTAFDEITIGYRGPTKAKRQLLWQDKASKERLPLMLDFSRGDEISPNIFRLVLTLDKPILSPVKVKLKTPGSPQSEGESHMLSPENLQKAIFSPCTSLDDESRKALLARIHNICKEGGAQEPIGDLLSDVGLSAPYFGDLERDLPYLLSPKELPNSPIAEKLFTLLAIEALIADKPAANLFAPISPLVGYQYHLEKPVLPPGWKQFGRRLFNENAPQWPLLVGRPHGNEEVPLPSAAFLFAPGE